MVSPQFLRPKTPYLTTFRVNVPTDLPIRTPYGLRPPFLIGGWANLLRHSIGQTFARQYWNINQLSITYAFRPRLRCRLTLGGRTFPRKPWDFGGQDSHLSFRYSCPHNHYHAVHSQFPSCFAPHGTLLYHDRKSGHPQLRQ